MAQTSTNRIVSRFTEVDAAPDDVPLSEEYRSEPLVSLNESLKDLFPSIQFLAKYVGEARNNCYYPNEYNLARDESAAIYLYTIEWPRSSPESLYILFNRDLRSKNRSKARPWLAYIKLLMVALDKLPPLTISVWRSLREDVSRDYKKGKRFIWRSATSCSRDANQVIDNFTDVNGNSTIFRIDATNGKDISAYSKIKSEKEVLLVPGTRFRVTRGPILEEVAGYKPTPVIHLEEI